MMGEAGLWLAASILFCVGAVVWLAASWLVWKLKTIKVTWRLEWDEPEKEKP